MGRAKGINAEVRAAFESVYGTPPSSAAFKKLSFISLNLGAEQPLIEDDSLGNGREGLDPVLDVVTNDGDVVVPVDIKGIGMWLKLLFGAPATSGSSTYTHVFTSGAAALPSMTIEVGHPEIPKYFPHIGVVGNQLRISMSRSGQLNATIGCIAQGEQAASGTSLAAAATLLRGTRFANASGEVSMGGSVLGGVTGSDFTFSNNFEKVETIRSDGLIDGADPLKVMFGGSVTVRFADTTLLDAATAGTPVALSFGWEVGAYSLLFAAPRVYLPRAKRPISGPGGVQASFNWQASGSGGHAVTATLVNDVASY